MRVLAPLVTFIFSIPFEGSLGRELTSSRAFTTLSLIAMLNAPIGTLLRTIPSMKAGLACCDRIQSSLESDSHQFHVVPLNALSNSGDSGLSKDPGSIADVNVEADRFELENFQLKRQHSSETVIDVRNASFSWSRTGPP
jgi:ATP-binding cassette subfamily C (CFTR/MRP) protein 1